MRAIYDRLYGKLDFPPIIQSLLDCPALLRLRDVRMANIQFVAFPAFSNSSRYEHSLGVCYLAGICADKLNLPIKDKIELMMACLYHDVGTPPFAHAMEEVLQAEYGFDHEKNLKHLIEGTNHSFVGQLDQIYLDGSIKLRSICQSKQGRRLGLDIYRIAKIIVGDKQEPLSVLLNGDSMDLDNIDNVIRASSAMGLISHNDLELAKTLAGSFMFNYDGKICFNGIYKNEIKRWQQIRDIQYTAIFESVEDFAYQAMIKSALEKLIAENNTEYKLSMDSWKLTDSEIIHNYLLKNSESRPIIQDVLLNKPYRNLGVLYVSGEDASSYINKSKCKIEKIVSKYYSDLMGLDKENCVVVNFYPDKRSRPIRTEALLLGTKEILDDEKNKEQQGALLGLFTPYLSDRYITQISPDGNPTRKKAKYSLDTNIIEIIKLLKSTILSGYEVTKYGKEKNGRSDDSSSFNQLGFF